VEKDTTQTTINQYWKDKLIKDAESYITLKCLGRSSFIVGKPHSLLDNSLTSDTTRKAVRMAIKLKLETGTYILQEKRSENTC